MANGGGRGGRGKRLEQEARAEEAEASAVKKGLVLQGNLNEKIERLQELRDDWIVSQKKRAAANEDAKAILAKVEELGVSRKAFKHSIAAVDDMTPEQRENYDDSLQLCRKAFGFSLDGQGLLFEGDGVGDADAGEPEEARTVN